MQAFGREKQSDFLAIENSDIWASVTKYQHHVGKGDFEYIPWHGALYRIHGNHS